MFQVEQRGFSLELRVFGLSDSKLQTNHRVFPRSSSVFRLKQWVFRTYQGVILEKPSMSSTTESRFSTTLRVLLEDEEKVLEKQCVVLIHEAVFSMDL